MLQKSTTEISVEAGCVDMDIGDLNGMCSTS